MSSSRLLGLALVAAVLGAMPVLAAPMDTGPAWSPTVDGVHARLFTAPNKQKELDESYDIYIEFEETGIDTSLGLTHRPVTIHFDKSEFQFTVADSKGVTMDPTSHTGGAAETGWDLVLPPGGKLSFPIGTGGGSPHLPAPGQALPKGKVLGFTKASDWLLLDSGGMYKVTAVFSSPTAPPGPDAADKGWSGTLALPPISVSPN
jgi:hypothetical protein